MLFATIVLVPMDKNKKNKKSFTLIELLIAISLIILISGLTIPFYNQFTAQQELKNETKKIVDLLELARKKAISGDLSNHQSDCANFTGYQIRIVNSTTLQLFICCGQTTSNYCSTSFVITTYNLPNQFSITPVGSNIQFKNLTGYLDNSYPLNIKNSLINKCISITISPSGLINYNDNLISC